MHLLPNSLYLHVVWNVSPEIYGYRWYSMLMGLAVMYGGFLSLWFFKRENKPQSEDVPITGVTIAAAIIGARLAHVFFYDWPYYSKHPEHIPIIWMGGLASHGALVGVIIAIYLYCHIRGRLHYWWVYDRIALAAPLIAAMIRVGNLFNSELYGKPADLPWAFIFTRVDMLPRHPVQLYEAAGYLLIGIYMMWAYLKRPATWQYGRYTAMFLTLANTVRFFMEYFKDMPVVWGPFTMGQWLSLPFIALGLLIWWLSLRGKLK
ncbi:MAG: prolipoprotein diacylglyceryl transferase [Chitinophagales bacterium]|nr:prolipoprotein diacylglyceryl transferase [Chitinophagales bacterium]